ncbi:hypothetical protein ABPG72_011322 [Tetrahymena utriculariae]
MEQVCCFEKRFSSQKTYINQTLKIKIIRLYSPTRSLIHSPTIIFLLNNKNLSSKFHNKGITPIMNILKQIYNEILQNLNILLTSSQVFEEINFILIAIASNLIYLKYQQNCNIITKIASQLAFANNQSALHTCFQIIY